MHASPRVPVLILALMLCAGCSGATASDDAGGLGTSDAFENGSTGGRATGGSTTGGTTMSTAFEGLVINEVAASGEPEDWVELYNSSDQAYDLTGVSLSDDSSDPAKGPLAAGTTIPAGGYLQLLRNTDFDFGLGGDEEVGLYDMDGNAIDFVDWADGDSPDGQSYGRFPNGSGAFKTLDTPTPAAANIDNGVMPGGCGDSIIQAGESCDGTNLNEATCESLGMGPGTLSCDNTCMYDTSACAPIQPMLGDVVINEVTGGGDDNIELFNRGMNAVDLSGWYVADSGWDATAMMPDEGQRYVFPAGTMIMPGQYLNLIKDTDHTFGLSGGGDEVFLYDGTDMIVDRSGMWADGASEPSFCRIPNGSGMFQTCSTATFGAENMSDTSMTCGNAMIDAGEQCDGTNLNNATCMTQGFDTGMLGCTGACMFDTSNCMMTTTPGRVLINEVTSAGDDNIELFNSGGQAVDLSGWYVADSGWDATAMMPDEGQRYVFPAGTMIMPGQYLNLIKDTDHTFGLSGGGDEVFLYDGGDTLIDQTGMWGTDEADPSYCRQPNATGAFQACTTASFGMAN